MAGIWSAEKQGAPQEEKGSADMTQKKLVISVPEKEQVMEWDEEECKTPTTEGSMIPSTLKCPPAPKKKPVPPPPRPPGSSENCYSEQIRPEEMEVFYRYVTETLRANQSRRSV